MRKGPTRRPRLIVTLTAPIQRFLALEATSSVLLLFAAIVALVWANSPWHESYEHFIHTPVVFGIGDFRVDLSLVHFVNDALMAVFFFVVGMEIKREIVHGELSTASRAMLPVMGALGGMVVPALIYTSIHWGGPAARGWGIPMATDIAFAVAAISLFGSRVPAALKIFLLALAIADDIGAIAVIAVFYTSDLYLSWLVWALIGLMVTGMFNRIGLRAYPIYVFAGIVVWYCTFQSGVHATIAGVALGFLTPADRLDHVDHHTLVERGTRAIEGLGRALGMEEDFGAQHRHQAARDVELYARATLSPLDFLTNLLAPWVAFLILPVFALCNAGVVLDTSLASQPWAKEVGIGVAAGLVLGKPIGVTLFSWLAVRSGLAELPRDVNWTAIIGTGMLAGIGFTVALFVSGLAFDDPAFTASSKLGILAGSFVATVAGLAALSRGLPRRATHSSSG